MSVPRSRLLDLMKVQCRVFATTFNPDGIRMGNKILRQRLRGPAMAAYYPPKGPTIQDLRKEFGSQFQFIDEDELAWADHVEGRKARGKGAPKKKKSAPDGKLNSRGKK